jgi:hypothetical protein
LRLRAELAIDWMLLLSEAAAIIRSALLNAARHTAARAHAAVVVCLAYRRISAGGDTEACLLRLCCIAGYSTPETESDDQRK